MIDGLAATVMRSTVASCHPWSTLPCKLTCRPPASHSPGVQRSTSPHQRLNRHLSTRLREVPAGQSRRVNSRASSSEVLVSFCDASAMRLSRMHATVHPQLQAAWLCACRLPVPSARGRDGGSERHTSKSGPSCNLTCAYSAWYRCRLQWDPWRCCPGWLRPRQYG